MHSGLLFNQLIHYPRELIDIMDFVVNEMFSELFPESGQVSVQVRPFNVGRIDNIRLLEPSSISSLYV